MSMQSTPRRITGLTVGGLALLLAGADTSATNGCLTVEGTYTEQASTDPGCTSPVGLCIEGTYRGSISGDFAGAATTLTSTVDTPQTGVLVFTSDSSTEARIGRRHGTLSIKNSGAFHSTGLGEIVDVQTIVGGAGDFAGASGVIRASGTFTSESGGRSSYSGTVCLP
jgi:hypothetical protein